MASVLRLLATENAEVTQDAIRFGPAIKTKSSRPKKNLSACAAQKRSLMRLSCAGIFSVIRHQKMGTQVRTAQPDT